MAEQPRASGFGSIACHFLLKNYIGKRLMIDQQLPTHVSQLSDVKRRLLDKYLLALRTLPIEEKALSPKPPGAASPLSFAQEQMMIRSQIPGIPPVYNETITVRRRGHLHLPLLERVLGEIIRRHEIWRTSYEETEDRRVQKVHPPASLFPLNLVDLQSLDPKQREDKANTIAADMACLSFDLATGPLLRGAVVKMDRRDYRLILIAHLSIVDGVSVYRVFPYELSCLYDSWSTNKPSPLRELRLQYGDYSWWQRERVKGQHLRNQLDYWREQFAGYLPTLQWPRKSRGPASFRGSVLSFVVPERLLSGLRQFSLEEGVTLFVTLQTGLIALIYRYTNSEEVITGTFSPSGRKRHDLQGLLGHFLHPVALRMNISSGSSFRDLLKLTQQVTFQAISHDDVPCETIAREVVKIQDVSGFPLFSVAVSLQPSMPSIAPEWEVSSMDASSGGAVWDLYVAFIERARCLLGRVHYNSDVVTPAMLKRLLVDLEALLLNAIAFPSHRVCELELSR